MAEGRAVKNATKDATTTSRIFSSRSEQLKPLEQEISGEDSRLKEQEAVFKYQKADKEAALLKTLCVAELAAVHQNSTNAGGLGSRLATSPSIINFLTITKMKKDPPTTKEQQETTLKESAPKAKPRNPQKADNNQ